MVNTPDAPIPSFYESQPQSDIRTRVFPQVMRQNTYLLVNSKTMIADIKLHREVDVHVT